MDNIRTILEKPGDIYVYVDDCFTTQIVYKALDDSIKIIEGSQKAQHIIERIKAEQARREERIVQAANPNFVTLLDEYHSYPDTAGGVKCEYYEHKCER